MKTGFGTWGIGGPTVRDGAYGKVDSESGVHLVRLARDLGIRLFDTAPTYGVGESILGASLVNDASSVIATKVSFADMTTAVYQDLYERFSRSIEISLARLNRSVIDILWLHNPVLSETTFINNFCEAASHLRSTGAIRSWGLSLASPMDCEKAMSFCPKYLQFNFSLLDQRGRSFLKSEKAQRIRIVVRSPFCSGLLSSRVIDYQRISAPLRRNTRLLDKLVSIREIFESRIARHGLSVPEVAFRFALSYANVDYVLSSFMSEGDITSAVRYEKSGPLAKGLTEELEELWEE